MSLHKSLSKEQEAVEFMRRLNQRKRALNNIEERQQIVEYRHNKTLHHLEAKSKNIYADQKAVVFLGDIIQLKNVSKKRR